MRARLGLSLLLLFLGDAPRATMAEGFEWRAATPESEGMAGAQLEALKDELAGRRSKALLVVRNDRIVYEWYAEGHVATQRHFTASLAKALVGGMALAVAIDDGHLRLDDPVSRYVPQWRVDPRKATITVRHLGSHTSGLDDSRPNEEAPWKEAFWQRSAPPNDPFTISRDQASVLFEAGGKLQYSNPGIAMLTYAVSAAMRDAPEQDVRALLRERILRPIGVTDDQWSIGYGSTFAVDGLPLVAAWGGGNFTARAAARIGRLVLREGDWDGKTVLTKDAVRQVTTDAGLPGNCGMGWWTNAGGRHPCLPRDAVWGAGAQDQVLLVVPSLQLILVRNGGSLDTDPEASDARGRFLFGPLAAAVIATEPPGIQSGSASDTAACVVP